MPKSIQTGSIFALRLDPIVKEVADDTIHKLPKKVFAQPVVDTETGKIVEFIVHTTDENGNNTAFECPAAVFAQSYHVAGDVIA